MAIAFTAKASGVSGNPSGGTTTASITIPLNDLFLCAVACRDVGHAPDVGTPSGPGLSNIVQVTTQLDDETRVTLWSAKGTGTASTVDIDFPGGMESFAYSITSVSGINYAGGALGNGVQQASVSNATTPAGGTMNTTALAALQSNSATYAAFRINSAGSTTPPSGWTEIHDLSDSATYEIAMETAYKVVGETNPSAAFSLEGEGYSTILAEILDVGGVSSNAWIPNTVWFNQT